MNKRRWIIGFAAVLLTVFAFKGIGWYRWSQLSSAEKAGTLTERMARHLDLSEEQKSKVYNLNLEKVQAFETAHNSGQHNRADWKQQRQQWKNQLLEVLTPEQRAKFKC